MRATSANRDSFAQLILPICSDICNLHRPTLCHDSTGDTSSVGGNWMALDERPVFGRITECRCHPIDLALSAHNTADLGFAKPRCCLGDGLQYRLEIECRTADHLQHVTRCGLIFERLLQVAGTLMQFGDQPRILDRDDRLPREIL